VAAQCNGKIINYAKIAADVGADDKTVKSYFSLLEDTLVGTLLEAWHGSIRKRVHSKPKFYFFDTGVTRALALHLSVPLTESTHAYGNAFEHYIIIECLRLSEYFEKDFRFFYLRTENDYEIDLIIDRPGRPLLLVEIKSATSVTDSMLKKFVKLASEFDNAESVCFSRDPYTKKIGEVLVLPWQEGIRRYIIES
jgi:predicted AAA+ superfamily ATPase